MAEENQLLGCTQGDNYDFKITMQAGDDLTGAEVEWILTQGLFYGAQTILKKGPGAGVDVSVNNTSGLWEIVVSLTPADTALIEPAVLYHQAKVKLGNGQRKTIEGGPFALKRSADPLATLLT